MLTFEQARERAASAFPDQAVATYGKVGEDMALVVVGPREWIVDRNRDFAPIDNAARLVDLHTGVLTTVAMTEVEDLLDAMEYVGTWPWMNS